MHDGRGTAGSGGLSWRGRNDGGKAKVGPDDPPIGAGARDPLQIDALGFGDARGKRADLDPVGQARARQPRLRPGSWSWSGGPFHNSSGGGPRRTPPPPRAWPAGGGWFGAGGGR